MKLWDYLFAPGVRPVSILLGFLVGGGTALFTDPVKGGFVGAVTALVTSLVYPTVAFLQDLPYIRLKKKLKQPFLFDVRVSMSSKKGPVDGFFVLTETSMVLLAISNTMHSLELSREDVRSVQQGENYTLNIFLNDSQQIRLRTPACAEVMRILAEQKWC